MKPRDRKLMVTGPSSDTSPTFCSVVLSAGAPALDQIVKGGVGDLQGLAGFEEVSFGQYRAESFEGFSFDFLGEGEEAFGGHFFEAGLRGAKAKMLGRKRRDLFVKRAELR